MGNKIPRSRPAPPTRNELALIVATPSGHMIAAGSARFRTAAVEFEIATLDNPGIVPLSVKGRYRDGRVVIDYATSDTQARPRISVQPRRLRDSG
jgi:hypothetical protein